jgi:two-component system sensor histidine kinase KdpD
MAGSYIPVRALFGDVGQRDGRPVKGLLLKEYAAGGTALVLAAAIVIRLGWMYLPWIVMAPAVVVACLIVSRSSLRAAKSEREAKSSADEMRKVYELTCRTLQMDLSTKPGAQLAELVFEIFSLESVAIFDADLHEVYVAGLWNADPSELAQNVHHFETVDDDRSTGVSRSVVRLGTVPVGSLIVRGQSSLGTIRAVAALIAITFDRYHALANENRIEAERQAEQLRAAVLDNLAHAYKTPLTAIRAASSGLTAMGRLSPGQADLVTLIDEQASLLSDLTTRLLSTARLDADDRDDVATVSVQAVPIAVGALIDEIVSDFGSRSSRMNVTIDLPDDTLVVACDRQLIAMLLTQYLDNAGKYSNPDSAITLRAVQSGADIQFSVHSFGPVIHLADRERIFDRYFRSASSPSNVSGTGIGLSIAKRVAVAHGGSVWVASDAAEGTTFYAAIPSPQQVNDSRRDLREALILERKSQ